MKKRICADELIDIFHQVVAIPSQMGPSQPAKPVLRIDLGREQFVEAMARRASKVLVGGTIFEIIKGAGSPDRLVRQT